MKHNNYTGDLRSLNERLRGIEVHGSKVIRVKKVAKWIEMENDKKKNCGRDRDGHARLWQSSNKCQEQTVGISHRLLNIGRK